MRPSSSSTDSGDGLHFAETQCFRQPCWIAIILRIAGLGTWSFFAQVVFDVSWRSKPVLDEVSLAIVLLCGIGLLALFACGSMRTAHGTPMVVSDPLDFRRFRVSHE